MRRVFENSVKTAHSTSIARPCDGGVSELFRSCFCALALGFPPTAGAPEQVFRPAYFRPAGSKRTAFRFASLTLRLRPVRAWPARGSGRLIGPLGQTHGLQVRFAHPPTSPRAGKARPGFRMAYFRPAGSKRACSRFASLTLRLRPARATPARGSGRLIFALRAQNAHAPGSLRSPSEMRTCSGAPANGGSPRASVPAGLFSPVGPNARPPGSLRSPSELRPARATPARGSAWLIFALWAQNAHAPGPLALTLRTSPRAGAARPGFRPAYFRPLGSKRTASRSAGADPPNFASRGRGPPGVPAGVFSPCGLKAHLLQVRTGWTRVLVRRGC